MSLFDKLKKTSKGLFDAGAKQMLKTDILFLEREIQNRKKAFGCEIYDMMEKLESNTDLSVSDKEAKIRGAFDSARKDIAVIRAKRDCKNEEMAVMDAESATVATTTSSAIPPSSGTVLTNQLPNVAS